MEENSALSPNQGCNSSDASHYQRKVYNNDYIISEPYSEGHYQIKVYKRRWLVLLLLCLVNFSNGCIWLTLTSISSITTKYFNQSFSALNWLSNMFLLAYPVLFIPSSYFLTEYGCKLCLALAAAMNGVGSALKYAGSNRDGFVYVAVGQCVCAVANTFTLQVPPFLSAIWFAENEKATATAVGVMANLCGVSVGFFMSSAMVHDDKTIEMLSTGEEIRNLLLTQAILCAISFPLVLICIKKQPRYPPSVSQALFLESKSSGTLVAENNKFHVYIVKLCSSLDYHLLSQAYAIMFGVIAAISSLLNELLSPFFPGEEKWIGLLGALQNILGVASMFTVGLLVDKFKHYKLTAVLLFMATLLSMIAFSCVLLISKSLQLTLFIGSLIGLCGIPYFSSGLEQMAEVTYPVPEGLSSAYPIALGNLYGFILLLVLGVFIEHGWYWSTCMSFSGLLLFGLLLVAIAKTPMKRTHADNMSGHITQSNTKNDQ